MTAPVIERHALLERLDAAPRAVLLCGPTGFGKSELLRQWHARQAGSVLVTARAGQSLERLLHTVPREASRVLIDDAWTLTPSEIEALLSDVSRSVALTVRHHRYARVQRLETRGELLLLDARDLAFTTSETAQLCQRPRDVYASTLGWPVLTAYADRPTFDQTSYLQDLLNELPPGLSSELLGAEMLDVWDATLRTLIARRDGRFEALMDTGIAIVPQGAELVLHPLLWEHVLTQLPPRPVPPSLKDAAQAVRAHIAEFSAEEARNAVEAFFIRHDSEIIDSTETLEAKIALLNDLGLAHMGAMLRDRYASCLFELGHSDEARAALIYQRDQGQASTRTYVLLALLSNFRNDFDDFEAQLQPMKVMAITEADWCQAWDLDSLYRIRCGQYDEGVEAADRMYRHAIASCSVELHVRAARRLSYAFQLKGDLEVGLHWAYQAIRLLDSHPDLKQHSALAAKTYHFVADMLKDAGKHDEALQFIVDALALLAARGRDSDRQRTAVETTIAYLYTTRGLLYLELGRVGEAVDALQRSADEFERADNRAGLPMALTYLAAALYRAGRVERLGVIVTYLQQLARTARMSHPEHDEQRAFQPLVEGLFAHAEGNVTVAVEHLRAIRRDGVMTYDSVLLAQLYLLRFLDEQGRVQASDVSQLIEVLDHRGASGEQPDVTAIMYAPAFSDVFETCRQSGLQVARWQRILDAAPMREVRARHVIRVTTLGRAGLEINGQPVVLRNTYPVLALTYLWAQSQPVSAERMGEALWPDKPQAARNATSAMSMLRKTLRDVDAELEGLLSGPHAGYAVQQSERWRLEVDVAELLAEGFSPSNADEGTLWRLLADVRVFLPRFSGPFVEEMQEVILRRARSVAVDLSDRRAAAGDGSGVVRALLLYLRLDVDLQLIDQLLDQARSWPELPLEELRQFASQAHGPATWDESLVTADRLSRLAALQVVVSGSVRWPA